jgi:Cdc6-like AAA superfamily ATPase
MPNFLEEFQAVADMVKQIVSGSTTATTTSIINCDDMSSASLGGSRDMKTWGDASEMVEQGRASGERMLEKSPSILDIDDLVGLEGPCRVSRDRLGWVKTYLQWTEAQEARTQNVLLYGPSGTGKTSLAWSFAKWTGLKVFEVRQGYMADERVGVIEKYFPSSCSFHLVSPHVHIY